MANENNRFGPENPHPLSALKTELVWKGKYDEYGNRREIDVAGCAMPFPEKLRRSMSRDREQRLKANCSIHRNPIRTTFEICLSGVTQVGNGQLAQSL